MFGLILRWSSIIAKRLAFLGPRNSAMRSMGMMHVPLSALICLVNKPYTPSQVTFGHKLLVLYGRVA